MRPVLALALLLPTLAGADVGPALTLPVDPPDLLKDVSLRLVVAGDGGTRSETHASAFDGIRRLLARGGPRSIVVLPGDLTYEDGLPDACPDAASRLHRDYLDELPAVDFFAVAGNHDHNKPGGSEHREVALRHAYFDCRHAKGLSATLGWDPGACPCLPRWNYPSGFADAGARELVPAAPGRAGFTLVTYDSQSALARPGEVAASLARVLDAVPITQRVILMGHHPWRSVGGHAKEGSDVPQDLASAPYSRSIKALETVLSARPGRVLVALFGHDHSTQFWPGAPAIVIAGATGKTSGVMPAPPGVAAIGDAPGFAVVDLLRSGAARVTLVHAGKPVARDISVAVP